MAAASVSKDTLNTGCFTKHTLILTKEPSGKLVYRSISKLKPGDDVIVQGNRTTKIKFILEYRNRVTDIYHLTSWLGVTPYHPVQKSSSKGWTEWCFPKDVFEQFGRGRIDKASVPIDIYDLVLDDYHTVYCGDFRCVTLGHHLSKPAVSHDYFGTSSIVEDIAEEHRRQGGDGMRGVVTIYSVKAFRDPTTGRIVRYLFNP
jgi:hypothetical protein